MTAPDFIVLWLCIVSAGRIITYRRAGARFKRQYSIIAWLLLSAIGALGIYILGGRLCSDHHPYLLPMMIIITTGLLYTRGNVAELIRIAREITQ